MLRNIFLLLIFCISTYSSCRKGVFCNANEYSFLSNISAFPDSDSINVHDTIWLEYDTSVELIDVNTGNLINYSNAENLGTAINFFEFIGGSLLNPGVMPAVNAFEYKLIDGTFVSGTHLPDQVREYDFIQVNNRYRFKLGIIPQRPGIFSFSPGNATNVYRRNDECTKASFTITFANTAQHLYFYEQNRPGYTPSEYERTHMYCFKVK